jgi:hypothetical protein
MAGAERVTETDTGVDRALRLGSIEIAEDGIAECTPEGHRLVFVPRSGIVRVTVVHGFTGERPIAALLGAMLCLGGTTAIIWAMIASFDHGHVRFVTVTPVVLLGVIGTMLLWSLVRRGRYLRVETARSMRKLLLHDVRDRDALRELLHVAKSRWGYAVELSSFDEAWPARR